MHLPKTEKKRRSQKEWGPIVEFVMIEMNDVILKTVTTIAFRNERQIDTGIVEGYV